MEFEWDRLLETCVVRNSADILLSPGAAPMLRLADRWRPLLVPPLDVETIRALVSLQLGDKPAGREDGYAYWEFRHREVDCQLQPVESGMITRFRAFAFGYPATTVLLVSRCHDNAPGGGASSSGADR